MVLSVNKVKLFSVASAFILSVLPAPLCTAQKTQPTLQTQAELMSFAKLTEDGKALLEKARAGNGSASITLSNYQGHRTMLSARTASGGAEQHMHYADFLVVLAGEGIELTGGAILDRKEGVEGEIRGSKLDGATAHPLHAGDVLHIPAGIPHQAIEAPGQSITVFVIKVQESAN